MLCPVRSEEPFCSLSALFSPNTLLTGVSGAYVSCPPAHMVASSSPSSHLQADKAAEPIPTPATGSPSSAGSLFKCQAVPERYGKVIAPGGGRVGLGWEVGRGRGGSVCSDVHF